MAFYDKQHRGLILLLLGATVALAGATVVDYPLTKWCGQHNWPAFSDFMSRSLFEGERPGGGDPVILFLVGMVCAYALSRRPSAPERIAAWRPALGFMLVGGILTAFVYVHMLKWLVARARPYLVFGGQQAFSAWYEIGPHFVTEGIYRGSFPSGHTAQVFAMMVLAYALAGSPSASRGQKTAGWMVGAGVAGYTLAMGLARCMSGAHWVTDVVGAMAISWVTLHVLYFKALKVPQQQRHWRALSRSGGLKDRWELFSGFAWWLPPWELCLQVSACGHYGSTTPAGWPYCWFRVSLLPFGASTIVSTVAAICIGVLRQLKRSRYPDECKPR